jgi:hypothetical protein
MNETLMADFTEDEIKRALDSIGDLKLLDRMAWLLFFIRSFVILWGGRSQLKSWSSFKGGHCRNTGMRQS